MDNFIDVQKHKGYSIKIYQDECYEGSPDDWGDDQLFLVSFNRDLSVDREGFDRDVCAYLMEGDGYDDYDIERGEEIKEKYYYFGLEAYIHSGIRLALSYTGRFPDREWDVSQLGVVFISKDIAENIDEARECAEVLLSDWNSILSGEIYGFIAVDSDGEEVDSCWGFIGDPEKNGMIDNAQSSIDYDIKQKTEKRLKKLKAYIQNIVPLDKRFI